MPLQIVKFRGEDLYVRFNRPDAVGEPITEWEFVRPEAMEDATPEERAEIAEQIRTTYMR